MKQALEIEARERGEDTELAAEILGGVANVAYVRKDYETADGQVRVHFKKPTRAGATYAQVTPDTFLARLCGV